MSERGGVPIAWREPFSMAHPYTDVRAAGESVLEIVQSVPDLPPRFYIHGAVHINGVEIPRENWRLVRPHPSTIERPIALTMTMPLAGGGAGGGTAKSVIGLVGAIALTLVTGGIAAGSILGAATGLLGTSLGIGATAFGQIAAGVVGLAGALALKALTKPPTPASGSTTDPSASDTPLAASASGNTIAPGGAIPRVVGTRRIFPPLIGSPIVELINDDEYVSVGFALNGPHLLEEPRVGGSPIADADDIESEYRAGWLGDTPLDLIQRQGFLTSPGIELSSPTVDPENQDQIKTQKEPELDLPVWHGVASRKTPDEIWIHLGAPAGIGLAAAANDVNIPIRIRMRLRGQTTWRNLPEVHLSGRTAGISARRAILIKWTTEPETIPSVPNRNGFVYASKNSPGQSVLPTTTAYIADAYFSAGAGNDYLYNGVEGSTNILHTYLYSNRVEFYLTDAAWPRGIYEIEIKRGAAIDFSQLNNATYAYGGNSRDFFSYWYDGTTAKIAVSHENVADIVQFTRLQSIWNEHPAPVPGFALIALRALNRSVDNFSIQASGYVQDWNGTAWSGYTTTSNPAPHYVDVLSGALNLDPLPDDIRGDDDLVAWRTLCTANGWTCDAIIEDMRTQDALDLLASCGYARPYQSEVYGVTVDNNRAADAPTTIFSSNNMANFRWEKAFAKLPDGLVVTYRDRFDDENNTQIIVYRPGYTGGDGGLLESTTYEGLIDEDKVRARATFDLLQASLRTTFYYFDTDLEALVVRRGSLVGIQSDVIDMRAGQSLIKRVILNAVGDTILGLELNSEIPVVNEVNMHLVANMHAVANMHDVGVVTGIAIRRSDGTISTHALSNVTGGSATIMFATPIADTPTILGIEDDQTRDGEVYACLVVSGRISKEFKRMLVFAIKFNKDLTANVTLVDEAQGLIRYGS